MFQSRYMPQKRPGFSCTDAQSPGLARALSSEQSLHEPFERYADQQCGWCAESESSAAAVDEELE
jgi:hypothetical protein